ncbi:trypsin-like serine peptidase [Herbidospora mongoliensis]|uniref:trypsin-like serine peptidase n=1 Tax=Herbidospora mongoliensis TaxID=688067 RepID=UPI00083356B8|nr:trypsin-like serine protease [Herbidospora mongoliensis]
MSRRITLAAGGVAVALGAAALLSAWNPAIAPAATAPRSAPLMEVSAQEAAPPPEKHFGKGVMGYPLAAVGADMQKVAAYWTPARLKEASTYVPASKPSAGVKQTPSMAELSEDTALLSAPAQAAAASPQPMVGKVFFKLDDKEYWCSGSVVHSKNRNLVATAGHCGWSLGQNKPVENWIFIPSYANGSTDAGIYIGHTLYLHEDFSGAGDYDRDYAFVTVYRGFTWKGAQRVQGGRLEDKVGAFQFSSTKGRSRPVSVFGYPAGAHPDGSRPFDGQTVRSCSGTTTATPASAPTYLLENGVLLNPCPFTAGASGGPWVLGWNPVKKTGFLNGVTSLTWNIDADGKLDAASSPYFNVITARVYQQAAKQATS